MRQGEARFTAPRPDCPHPERWHSDDEQATEHEVSDLVGAFVRAIKPRYCVETGSYSGQTTVAIARAMTLNGFGHLVSLEVDLKRKRQAEMRVLGLELGREVTIDVLHNSSLEWEPQGLIDFAWLDSAGNNERELEFERFFPFFHEHTIVGIHDTGPHQGPIRESLLVLEGSRRFKAITLATPRGVSFGNVLTSKRRWSIPG